MFIDTHCHLHDREFFSAQQADEMLERARQKGVEKIICIGTNPDDSRVAQAFATKRKNVYWTYGIHPEFANRDLSHEAFLDSFFRDDVQNVEQANPANNDFSQGTLAAFKIMELDSRGGRGSESLDDESVPLIAKADKVPCMPVVIGEIGLDYHYDNFDRPAQLHLFEKMLQLAKDADLPVSLHLREAFDDALAVLDNFPGTRGVVHSFTGSKKDLKKLLARDFYIGVNGLATYTTPALPPLEKMVLETDAPFLTPVPFRGTINEPGYVPLIADCLSGKLGVDLVEIREQTTQNARKIFKI